MAKIQNVTTLGIDADDTLWHNERYFKFAQEAFADSLRDYADPVDLDRRLLNTERKNLAKYGFGIKGFTLSMIETAIEITERRVPTSVIQHLIALGQDMLEHPIDLLDGVGETIPRLAERFSLVLITKGDLLDQERKLAQSGLGSHFNAVEIVSDKHPDQYTRIFETLKVHPKNAVMIGNSIKSDILPALAVGAHAVHIPHDLLWDLEHAEEPKEDPRFYQLKSFFELNDLLEID